MKANLEEILNELNPQEKENFQNFIDTAPCYNCKNKADHINEFKMPFPSSIKRHVYPICNACDTEENRKKIEAGLINLISSSLYEIPKEEMN